MDRLPLPFDNRGPRKEVLFFITPTLAGIREPARHKNLDLQPPASNRRHKHSRSCEFDKRHGADSLLNVGV